MASKQVRIRTRQQLLSGISRDRVPLTDAKLVELWGTFLPLHVESVRPGRAVALQDAKFMIDSGVVRITEGLHASRAADTAHDSAAAADDSADDSATEARSLSPAEVRAIGSWLEKHRAETPAAASELRATEVFYARRLQWSGAVSP